MGLFAKNKKNKNENYERVLRLHEEASFLCYINDAYSEMYEGIPYVKLEGTVAFGLGKQEDSFALYSCNGIKKADVTMQELYVGTNKVDCLEGGDKVVALYPVEQTPHYIAGDLLVIMKKKENIEA